MYEDLYQTNPQTGNGVIDIGLDDYMDFFHEWDHDVFKKRDIHPELADFLDICSEDIPLKNKIEICFSIENEAKDESKELMILQSYRYYYGFFKRQEEKKIKELFIKVLILAFIGICFIFSNELLSKSLPGTAWAGVFLEGLMVGGWVFLWEALHLVTLESQDYFRRNRELKRFLNATIVFKYKNANALS